jgi:hypothetical protein
MPLFAIQIRPSFPCNDIVNAGNGGLRIERRADRRLLADL